MQYRKKQEIGPSKTKRTNKTPQQPTRDDSGGKEREAEVRERKGQSDTMQGIHSNFFSLVRTFGSSYDSMTADCCMGAIARAYVTTGVRHVVGSCLTCVCWVFLGTVSGFQSVVLVVFWCKKSDVPWDFQLCAYRMARWYITWKRTQKYHNILWRIGSTAYTILRQNTTLVVFSGQRHSMCYGISRSPRQV